MPGPAVSVQLGVCEVEVGIVAGASDHFYIWSNWMRVNGHIEALGFRVGCGEACVTRGISMDEIIGGTGGSMPKSKQYTLKR